MIYSCNYPVIHELNITGINELIDYTVSFGGKPVYNGRVHPFEDSGTVEIDISEICRNFLEPLYENIINFSGATDLSEVPQTDKLTTIGDFIVSSDNNPDGDATYKVAYDYNTDYISELPDSDTLNAFIAYKVDPRQRLYLTAYSNAAMNFTLNINGEQADTKTITSGVFANYGVNLNQFSLNKGDRVSFGTVRDFEVIAPCQNRFALYYVNKYGGLDSLLFTGRAIEGYNATDTDVKLYNDRLDRRDWEQKRIYREIDKTYQLNTGFIIRRDDSRLIDHLFNSPKVWIHDLEADTITSCLITDRAIQVAEYRYDGLVNYTINVKESQQQIRR